MTFGPMGDFGSGMGWGMLWAGVWNLLFWGAIIALVVWSVKRVTQGTEARRPSPMDIAQERLARGEITREQYEDIRQTLTAP